MRFNLINSCEAVLDNIGRLRTEVLKIMPFTKQDLLQIKKVVRESIEDLALAVQKGFEGVSKQFEGASKQFEQIDKRFDEIDKRLENVEMRLQRLETGFENLKIEVREIKYLLQQRASREELNDLDTRLAKVEMRLRKLAV